MILWFIAAFTAYFVKGLCGFANTFRIILYKILGLLTPDIVKSVLLLIPFAPLGLFIGIKCCGHMNDNNVRKITTVLLILSGISLVLKNL